MSIRQAWRIGAVEKSVEELNEKLKELIERIEKLEAKRGRPPKYKEYLDADSDRRPTA